MSVDLVGVRLMNGRLPSGEREIRVVRTPMAQAAPRYSGC